LGKENGFSATKLDDIIRAAYGRNLIKFWVTSDDISHSLLPGKVRPENMPYHTMLTSSTIEESNLITSGSYNSTHWLNMWDQYNMNESQHGQGEDHACDCRCDHDCDYEHVHNHKS